MHSSFKNVFQTHEKNLNSKVHQTFYSPVFMKRTHEFHTVKEIAEIKGYTVKNHTIGRVEIQYDPLFTAFTLLMLFGNFIGTG